MQRKHWLFFFYFSDSFLRIITYFDKFVTDCLQKYVVSVDLHRRRGGAEKVLVLSRT